MPFLLLNCAESDIVEEKVAFVFEESWAKMLGTHDKFPDNLL